MRYPDGYKVGEEVTVSINLRGREYTDKDGCKILQRNSSGESAPWRDNLLHLSNSNSSSVDQYETKIIQIKPKNEDEPDDLPFSIQ
jgi:hypothetical protein